MSDFDRLVSCIYYKDNTCKYLSLKCVDPRNKSNMITVIMDKIENPEDVSKIIIYPAGPAMAVISFDY